MLYPSGLGVQLLKFIVSLCHQLALLIEQTRPNASRTVIINQDIGPFGHGKNLPLKTVEIFNSLKFNEGFKKGH
jgi:hypothetical protein